MTTTETAPMQFAESNDVRYAYRRFGASTPGSIPIVFLQHFRGTIDHCDPDLVNPIAEKYQVVLFDNAGVGHSGGHVPDSIAEMAKHVERFLAALDLKEVYLYEFSLGGMVCQQVTLNSLHTGLVKKAFFVGSSCGRGPDTAKDLVNFPADPEGIQENSRTPQPTMQNMQKLFFYPSETSQAAGVKYWERIHRRNKITSGEERASYLPIGPDLMNMSIAGRKWATGEGCIDRLHEIKIPVLVSNGKDDYMLPTQHSWLMSQRMPNSQLSIYSDSGHGAGFQHNAQHAQHVLDFLNT